MKKVILAIILCFAMVATLAVPAFAAWGNNETTVTKFEQCEGMYIFDDTTTRAYLFVGTDKAVVVDTMYASSNLLAKVREITNLPLEVVITHGHPDHIGGIDSFKDCTIYIDQDDAYMLPDGITATYVADGSTISVGNYNFEVIEIPGHTYGSIALLDRTSGVLISGDSVQAGPIMMFDEECNMETYAASMKKLMAYQDAVKYVFAGHHDYPSTPEYITYCYEDAQAYLDGKLEPVPVTSWNGNATVYYGEHVSFQLPALEENETTTTAASESKNNAATVSQTGTSVTESIWVIAAVVLAVASVIVVSSRKKSE